MCPAFVSIRLKHLNVIFLLYFLALAGNGVYHPDLKNMNLASLHIIQRLNDRVGAQVIFLKTLLAPLVFCIVLLGGY